MSLGENPKPSRPARPVVLTIQPVRPAPPPPTTKGQRPSPPQEHPGTLGYINVLSEETHAKAGTAIRPPPPVPRRPVLSRGECFYQSTDAEDLNGDEDIGNSGVSRHNVNADGTEANPLYEDVLSNETGHQDCTTPVSSLPAPPRPSAPPRPAVVQPRRPFLPQTISELPAEHQYEYVPKVLPETRLDAIGALNGEKEPPDIRNAYPWHNVNADVTGAIPLYEDVLPNESGHKDCTTLVSPPPAPPRPFTPPHPKAVRPRQPFLSQSISEVPTEHLYEYIPDVLPETLLEDEGANGERSVCPVGRKPITSHPLRSWSEQSTVDGDSSTKELGILMEWWKSVDGWETFLKGHQEKGSETKLLISVAYRVKMGMRLYQLLVFQRGRLLLNHITELHCTADSLSRVGKNTRIAGITGGTTGAVGAAAVVAGIALAPLTFGASLVAAGIGVGVAAAGGVTGASAAITSKVKSCQVRSKVEKILKNCRFHMENFTECLEFIDVGMEHLRKRDLPSLNHLDTCALKIVQMAQQMGSFCSTDAISKYPCMLQGFASRLDSYFSEEDKLKLKKGSESHFAENIREVADKLKESTDELIRIKHLFHSVVEEV